MTEETKSQSQTEQLFTNPEPWEAWESKLVVWSIAIAIIGLAILGALINWLIL